MTSAQDPRNAERQQYQRPHNQLTDRLEARLARRLDVAQAGNARL